ncbi:molybdopterin biosynthesis protein MoeY [Pelomonas sp. APW6]|uniref:Molybdopterin biosynthesis protein MoeY n=1 Tax=Roseateles subflavus TaxID=3053353 RepID=A0ABT7LQL1_9BURK|nr:molybdopterin biosynthesis protein MoeY [Pelomonas sp. APW6]MDL5034005.1 molybdopterin biosynthesis protein MoeY [Pelomonas sp. APW6]
MTEPDLLDQLLDLARWAPSGDNTQPWRFERLGPRQLRIHGFDTRDHCVYDLDGHPSQISFGTLLETLAIAAASRGWQMVIDRMDFSTETRPQFDVSVQAAPDKSQLRLAAQIEKRSVQRRPLKRTPLTEEEKKSLTQCLPAGMAVHWLDEGFARLKTAKLLFHSAKLRLTIEEAYRVHRDIIEWHAQFSADKVPDQALGASPGTVLLMRQVMKSWQRVRFFNTFLAGTWAPRIELDFIPSLRCAAHFVIHSTNPPHRPEDYVEAGRAIQRFWLQATALEMQLQPEVTPLVFSRYSRESRPFSASAHAMPMAHDIRQRLELLIGRDIAERAVFMGRLGHGTAPTARSLRKPLAQLRA